MYAVSYSILVDGRASHINNDDDDDEDDDDDDDDVDDGDDGEEVFQTTA